MINLSQKNIVKIATSTGFLKDNIEKVLRLCDVLEMLFVSWLKEKLVLKGGTAINLGYLQMPRLSVDIDLDYIVLDRETMLADKAEIKGIKPQGKPWTRRLAAGFRSRAAGY